MAHKKTFRRKVSDYLYDHPYKKSAIQYSWLLLVTMFSAFLFAFGFRAFIAPTIAENRLISGGVSGISQTIIAIVELSSNDVISRNNIYDIIYSGIYFTINIPIFVLAWRGIGKRFAIFTLINVGLASAFTSLLRFADEPFFNVINNFISANGGLATRALLGGICTGVSSAIAYKVDASAGGMDVVAYYIALKKSRLVGRYSVYINIVTISIYTLISITDVGWGTPPAAEIFVATLFSVLSRVSTPMGLPLRYSPAETTWLAPSSSKLPAIEIFTPDWSMESSMPETWDSWEAYCSGRSM